MFKQFKSESRGEYGRETESGNLGNDDLKVGCLQRIADATEAMAKNYVALQRDLDFYKRRFHEEQAAGARLARSNAALRGLLKKAKRP